MRSFLLLSLLVFVGCGPGASALRCYSCEDCDENAQLSEMEVCDAQGGNGNGPDATVSSNPVKNPSAPAPAPAAPEAPAPAQNPSVPAATSDEDEEEDYDSDESSTIGIMPAGGNGNGGATGTGAAAAAGGAGGGDGGQSQYSEEEEEEDEDEEEEDKRRRRRQAELDMPIPVCYTVRLQLNETVITKRGCTSARMGNDSSACEGLFDNWTVGGCQICQNDGCNRPISGSSRIIGHGTIVLLAVMSLVGHTLI
ncbi:uncharacterized protein Dana_GF14638 [Drosophila ananassae]|uniref:DUF753 domain-containing protein n=1 Tax=Drosophila ananassae TaxID=7217 RepID=B3MPF6_DROAN|nr:nucleolin [Drosophila ananassae]EDV31252.1 uncharacterized protein Dana_GF14638 [Drosophila ananassae]